MSDYTPKLQHKFWTLGNIGRDSFGGPDRDIQLPVELVDVGMWGSVK